VDYTCWTGRVHGLASSAGVLDAGKVLIDQTRAAHFAKHSNMISASVHSEDGGSNGLYATAGSESESHNEDCIVPLPCPKRLLANYTKANPRIEVYCGLIGLLDFEK